MNKIEITCARCGKMILIYPSKIKPHNFCSRKCLAEFSNKSKNPDGYAELKNYENMSKHMSALNAELNPNRMTPELRDKLSKARLDSGAGKSYRKVKGRHEHRQVAEVMLGRPLREGEIVHHINRDKRDNRPENLLILSSQSEHAKLHAKEGR